MVATVIFSSYIMLTSCVAELQVLQFLFTNTIHTARPGLKYRIPTVILLEIDSGYKVPDS